jgi:hypothetical protein
MQTANFNLDTSACTGSMELTRTGVMEVSVTGLSFLMLAAPTTVVWLAARRCSAHGTTPLFLRWRSASS